jgi:hypothetical protein
VDAPVLLDTADPEPELKVVSGPELASAEDGQLQHPLARRGVVRPVLDGALAQR